MTRVEMRLPSAVFTKVRFSPILGMVTETEVNFIFSMVYSKYGPSKCSNYQEH